MDTLQGCATLKGPASDCLCAGWERDALQRCTIGKTVAPDIVNTGRDVKGCLHLPCRIVDQLGLGLLTSGSMFGIWGVLLGIPVYASAKVVISAIFEWYKVVSGLYELEGEEAKSEQ